jgi:hypothetical protein
MSAELLEPELRHAMLNVLGCADLIGKEGLRVMRARFVRNSRMKGQSAQGAGQRALYL